ncbi:pentatricopeptide repeat-containing protein At1g03540-like [Gossypium arboreum]|uniref:pentatricopeptide repeat-containing protein At1g03540-like n=1 Tax=Gossypium arboreum TaxID=29729 RepID=UPI0022F1C93B|nr:pentatricopeptide repeat-containing protein At1g03540-like [Gossypium arboreum]
MVSEYIRAGKPKSSLQLFLELVGLGIEPSGFTLSDKGLFDSWNVAFMGIMKRKFDSDNVIMTALIDFYGRNGQLNEVCQMFDELPEPDTICLDSVISALTRNGLCKELVGVWGGLRQGKQVHAQVITCRLGDAVLERSLLDMYGKCGLAEESQHVFDRMSKKDSLAWAALLGVYCQNKECESVIRKFREMRDEINSCKCKCNCGCFNTRETSSLPMSDRNLITRSSMIYGFAQNGRGGEALTTFNEMEGMEPDCISFTGVLYTCSHTGLVDEDDILT